MGGMMGMGMAQEEADQAQDEANDAVDLANQALDEALDAENLAQQAQDDAVEEAAEAEPVAPVDPNPGVQDQAEAVGDPHLKLSNGKKADLCCDGDVCKACPVLLQQPGMGGMGMAQEEAAEAQNE